MNSWGFDFDPYGDVNQMSLTDLHRAITALSRRQRKVAWLRHRARRINVLKHERSRRLQRLDSNQRSQGA